jgi:multiple sugar transport system substrate-binding protein
MSAPWTANENHRWQAMPEGNCLLQAARGYHLQGEGFMRPNQLNRRDFLRLSGLAAAGTAIAACIPAAPPQAGSAGSAAPAQATRNVIFVTTESTDSSSQLYEPLYQTFREEHPDITVTYLGIPVEGGWGAYFDKLAVTIAGGQKVDMGKIPTEGGRLAVARGLIRPIDDYMDATPELQDYFADVSPELAKVFVYNGKTYSLPYDFNNMMIWLNTKRLEEEGLELPPEDWTVEDFRRYANTLTRRDGDNVTHYGFSFWTSPFGLCPWLFNNGLDGMMTGDNLEIPLMSDPAYAEVIQFLHDLMYVDKVVPRTDAGNTVSFEAGTVAMQMAGRWPLSGYMQNNFQDFEVVYWPKGTRRVTEVGCGSLPIFTDAQEPDAAWAYITHLLRKDSIAYMVSTGANIPARRSVGTAPEFVAVPPIGGKLWYESIDREDIPVISVTAPPDFSEMEQISNRHLSQIFADEVTVIDGLAACQSEMEAMVARRPAAWAEKF